MKSEASQSQKIGFWSIVLLGINGIIGSGIFLLPSAGMKLFGPASIVVLFFDAFLAFVIAMCFADCASFFSKNGGPYLYAKEAFGGFVGYEVGFVTWVIRIIAEATLYVAFATALGGLFPDLNNPTAKNVIVTLMAVSLVALNVSGVKLTALISNVVTVGKLVPIALVIVFGLFFMKGSHFDPFFVSHLTTSNNFATTAITLFYIFTGFEALPVIAGEMTNAKKNLPKALMIALSAVALVYVLVMTVSVGVMGDQLASSTVPLKDTFEKIAGSFGGDLISLGMVLSVGGICISSSFITPRSGVALAENKMMPKVLAKKNRKNAPYVAIVFSTVAVLAIAYSGTFTTLAQISAVSRFAQFIPTCLAVLVFRHTKKDEARDFRLPLGPVIPIVALVISVWLLWHVTKTDLVWGFGALVVAVPFYFITKQRGTTE
ncbi:APC family permease [Fructobacillus ficulneus]|uniref:Amino acid permease n=1 Tax=Fructobacillus ficulneus TaxID=157463 RepID=A0A0K8MH78_9LACO|nr:APC family permease [Fructobacillus ficulneus]GAO99518.1 amino acid permease [Fructobacillus ficulneus]